MRVLVLTDRSASEGAGRPLATTVREAVAGGADAVLLREKDLDRSMRRALGEGVADACAPADLFVASDVDLARTLGARGVHLAQQDPWPEVDDLSVGRSCHDRDELEDAAAHGAAHATVSPVWPTPSKPGYGPALGPDGLATLVATARLPVLALGGVTPERAAQCIRVGAAGVAVMGGVMAASEPAEAVHAIVTALNDSSIQEDARP